MLKLEEVIGKVLGVKPEDITDKSSPLTIPAWDSFNGLLLVTELEKNFGVNFTVEEIGSVKEVGDIKTVLRKHGIAV